MRNPFTAQPQFWRTWLAVSLHIFLNLVIGLVLLAGLITFAVKILSPPPPVFVFDPCPEARLRQAPTSACYPLDGELLPPPPPAQQASVQGNPVHQPALLPLTPTEAAVSSPALR